MSLLHVHPQFVLSSVRYLAVVALEPHILMDRFDVPVQMSIGLEPIPANAAGMRPLVRMGLDVLIQGGLGFEAEPTVGTLDLKRVQMRLFDVQQHFRPRVILHWAVLTLELPHALVSLSVRLQSELLLER